MFVHNTGLVLKPKYQMKTRDCPMNKKAGTKKKGENKPDTEKRERERETHTLENPKS